METIDDVIQKKMSKSLLIYIKLVDPDRKYGFDTPLIEAWNALTLVEQRRLYLYLLYRKWRGEGFYGTPYEIVKNCHPCPTNWNGRPLINRLMKETPMVRAKHNGEYGIYTRDEAFVWQMTEIIPLNY
jgi:hypothetical protein